MRPQDVLPDDKNTMEIHVGTPLRKGTVAASLANATAFDSMRALPYGDARRECFERLLRDQEPLMLALQQLGLFELFSLQEWLAPCANGNQGRHFLAVLSLQIAPHGLTTAIRDQLMALGSMSCPELQNMIQKLLLFKNTI